MHSSYSSLKQPTSKYTMLINAQKFVIKQCVCVLKQVFFSVLLLSLLKDVHNAAMRADVSSVWTES